MVTRVQLFWKSESGNGGRTTWRWANTASMLPYSRNVKSVHISRMLGHACRSLYAVLNAGTVHGGKSICTQLLLLHFIKPSLPISCLCVSAELHWLLLYCVMITWKA